MKSVSIAGVVLFAWLGASPQAVACSCASRVGARTEVVERAFDNASEVVVARVISVEQSADAMNSRLRTEGVTLLVLDVLKGKYAKGAELRTQSTLGPYGPCGKSVRNSPVWIEGADGKEVELSDKWLLFLTDSEPYNLSICDLSSPMNLHGEVDLHYIYKLIKKRRTENGN